LRASAAVAAWGTEFGGPKTRFAAISASERYRLYIAIMYSVPIQPVATCELAMVKGAGWRAHSAGENIGFPDTVVADAVWETREITPFRPRKTTWRSVLAEM